MRFKTSTPYMDMIASQLRSQILTMHNVLETIERTQDYGDDYIRESLKTVEDEIRRIRGFLNN